MDLNIAVGKTLLQPGEMKKAKPLVGFDLGEHLYHVVLFPEAGGAIGVIEEGNNFCARLTLDSLVGFYLQARANHIEGSA